MGSEALADGSVTRQILRTQYVKLHYNVYARAGVRLNATDRAVAAWLWSRRTATLAGISAAALHGTRWLPDDAPAELVYPHLPAPPGIVNHRDALALDEVCTVARIDCTSPARTAYDIGRRVPGDAAIICIDALLNARGRTVDEVAQIAERYPGARGIRRLRTALALVDPGAESPQETRLRLLLTRAGLRPVTQIWVGRRRVDMGYPEFRVGVEYDGQQHWTDPRFTPRT